MVFPQLLHVIYSALESEPIFILQRASLGYVILFLKNAINIGWDWTLFYEFLAPKTTLYKVLFSKYIQN